MKQESGMTVKADGDWTLGRLLNRIEADRRTGVHPELGPQLEAATEGERAFYDLATAQAMQAVVAVLYGVDTGAGVASEPWESVRRSLLKLISQTKMQDDEALALRRVAQTLVSTSAASGDKRSALTLALRAAAAVADDEALDEGLSHFLSDVVELIENLVAASTQVAGSVAWLEQRMVEAYIAGQQAADATMRPSVVFRPALRRDGDQWCALYGENVQEGLAGFGATPAEAMKAFDALWEQASCPARPLHTPEQGEPHAANARQIDTAAIHLCDRMGLRWETLGEPSKEAMREHVKAVLRAVSVPVSGSAA